MTPEFGPPYPGAKLYLRLAPGRLGRRRLVAPRARRHSGRVARLEAEKVEAGCVGREKSAEQRGGSGETTSETDRTDARESRRRDAGPCVARTAHHRRGAPPEEVTAAT